MIILGIHWTHWASWIFSAAAILIPLYVII